MVCGGTTGEFPSLTLAERRVLLEACRANFSGEVLAHVSATNISDVRELIEHAQHHADAVLLLPPYYYADAPPAGVVDFFVACMAGSKLPLYLYNFPRHTQHPITPALLKATREHLPHLRGVKDSSGSIEKVRDLAAAADGVHLYMGSDSSALRVLQEGLAGSVTGGGNPVPYLLTGIFSTFEAGDVSRAEELQTALNSWSDARRAIPAPEISVVKAALEALVPGFHRHVRPPLVALTDDQAREIGEVAKRLLEQNGSE